MQTDLSPVSVFTVVASSVFSLEMAAVIGPYIVIAIGAMGGAAVAIMQREGAGSVRAFIYFVSMTALSMLLTVPLSMLAVTFFTPVQEQWLFAPVSFGLGFAGDKWGSILLWAAAKLNALIDMLIAARGQK